MHSCSENILIPKQHKYPFVSNKTNCLNLNEFESDGYMLKYIRIVVEVGTEYKITEYKIHHFNCYWHV